MGNSCSLRGVCCVCCHPFSSSLLPSARLDGLVAVVTGVTVGGIGFELSCELARRGAHVVLAGRSRQRLSQSEEAIRERLAAPPSRCGSTCCSSHKGAAASSSPVCANAPPLLTSLLIDLADFSSIASFASAFSSLHLPLNILIHNAGILGENNASFHRAERAEGVEMTVATNYVGPVLLTEKLLPFLLEGSKQQREKAESGSGNDSSSSSSSSSSPSDPFISRVIHLASVAHSYVSSPLTPARFPHLFYPSSPLYFDSWDSYAYSKLFQILHSSYCSLQFDPSSELMFFSAHPGVVHTALGGSGTIYRCVCCLCAPCFLSPDQGASTPLLLALSSSAELSDANGKYFASGKQEAMSTRAIAQNEDRREVERKLNEYTRDIIDKWSRQQETQTKEQQNKTEEEKKQSSSSSSSSSAIPLSSLPLAPPPVYSSAY